ncbi:NINE protein [Sporosarcina luteola]|nr:NINE protein [Sporosarcina luteola]
MAIFLGGLGIHKFYLGKWGWGILYILFCWTYIPSLIGLIEGIIYLVSNQNNFARKYDPGFLR